MTTERDAVMDRVDAVHAEVRRAEGKLRARVMQATEEWMPVNARLKWLEGHAYHCADCLPTIGTSAEGMAHE